MNNKYLQIKIIFLNMLHISGIKMLMKKFYVYRSNNDHTYT
jgi:hypothetical protein